MIDIPLMALWCKSSTSIDPRSAVHLMFNATCPCFREGFYRECVRLNRITFADNPSVNGLALLNY